MLRKMQRRDCICVEQSVCMFQYVGYLLLEIADCITY